MSAAKKRSKAALQGLLEELKRLPLPPPGPLEGDQAYLKLARLLDKHRPTPLAALRFWWARATAGERATFLAEAPADKSEPRTGLPLAQRLADYLDGLG